MRKLITCVLAAVLLSAMPAFADAPAGTTKGVKPAADAALDGASRTLVVGSDIFIGDQVSTGPKGQVQILFNDNTKLVVGPNSSLKVADYLVRNNGDAGKFVVDMLSGSFRFATGDAPKNKYQINTPTGTIGVRGTEFDVWVDGASGFARILRVGGIVLFRANGESKWRQLADSCEIGQIGDGSSAVLGDARKSTGDTRTQYKRQFRYADNQSPLLRAFWFMPAYACLHNPPNAAVHQTDLNVTSGGTPVVRPQTPPSRGKPPPPPP